MTHVIGYVLLYYAPECFGKAAYKAFWGMTQHDIANDVGCRLVRPGNSFQLVPYITLQHPGLSRPRTYCGGWSGLRRQEI